MAAIEFWTNGAGMPSAFAQRARRAEANGWDGITIVDSQNLSGDCYVGLAVTAAWRVKGLVTPVPSRMRVVSPAATARPT